MRTIKWNHFLGVVVGVVAIVSLTARGDQGHVEPQSVTAACGLASADVSWAAVQDSHLSGYNVYDKASGASDYTKANGALVTATHYTVSGLASGVTYEFRVVAVYDDGQSSAMSAPSSCTAG